MGLKAEYSNSFLMYLKKQHKSLWNCSGSGTYYYCPTIKDSSQKQNTETRTGDLQCHFTGRNPTPKYNKLEAKLREFTSLIISKCKKEY